MIKQDIRAKLTELLKDTSFEFSITQIDRNPLFRIAIYSYTKRERNIEEVFVLGINDDLAKYVNEFLEDKRQAYLRHKEQVVGRVSDFVEIVKERLSS